METTTCTSFHPWLLTESSREIEPISMEALDNDGATALNLGSRNGHIDVVKLLLSVNANVEAADKYGATPLSWAAENGHVDVVKLLLNASANIETTDNKYGRTPLSWAAAKGHVDVVKLLSGI